MSEYFVINISSYEKNIFKGNISSATLTSDYGEFSITKNHIPTISMLKKNAKIAFTLDSGEKRELFVNQSDGGFCIFENNVLNVFA